MQCFCEYSGSALLGDLHGVSVFIVECAFLSVLSIYPRSFLSVFLVYHLLLWIHYSVK